ncbi:hypothetical protein L798_00196 [Zootermopsis nevadensis]|uniref:Uncharacterized protein n=1 Tax=Zootermopsis nevadensis TaxID=136037 RepID=A0A067QZ24_ZOONE|nr:hypothetical protein L798_00196 [Zootermopsis nevadensis]
MRIRSQTDALQTIPQSVAMLLQKRPNKREPRRNFTWSFRLSRVRGHSDDLRSSFNLKGAPLERQSSSDSAPWKHEISPPLNYHLQKATKRVVVSSNHLHPLR